MTIVIKKNGEKTSWKNEKIREAVMKSSNRVKKKEKQLTEEQITLIFNQVEELLKDTEEIKTTDIHDYVMKALYHVNRSVFHEYKAYRNYKERFVDAFSGAAMYSNKIVHSGDKENANKDSTLNSTKQALISEGIMKEFMRQFELEPEWIKSHDEGWIHIHDLPNRYLGGINCCIFDMASLLKDGFEMNGSLYFEPKSVATAFAVVGDATLSASAQQYGGFSIGDLDSVMAPYAEKSYKKHLEYFVSNGIEENLAKKLAEESTIREIEQGYQGFETKLNTVSNSLGQIPFVTISIGLNTTKWGQIISSTILKVRKEGIGKNRVTAIFPKIVMLTRSDVNKNSDSPNHKIYLEAIECSKTRLYPDYLSLDNPETNNLAQIYERTGEAVTPMGCRAFLAEYEEDGKEIYKGRFNIGAVSLNLTKIAIESNGDENKFFELIDKYAEKVFDIHEDYYRKLSKIKASSNPLLFVEGGAFKKLNPGDTIEDLLKAATASLGYVGIEEAMHALKGEKLVDNKGFALKIVKHLENLVESAKKTYGRLFALYSSPAENLIYRFNELNKKHYGAIPNVTSREYMTNSFHVPVFEDISVPEKIDFESDFHAIARGGRISYCEFPYNISEKVLKQAIDFAMDRGLYYGVNVISSTCNECDEHGDFQECPKCGSDNVTSVSRVCGYLSFGKIKGDSRYNIGKQAEIRERVKHGLGDVNNG